MHFTCPHLTRPQLTRTLMLRTLCLILIAAYLVSCTQNGRAQETPPPQDVPVAPFSKPVVALPIVQSASGAAAVPLNRRHPDAGIWMAYRGRSSVADLQKPYIRGAMAYAPWNKIYLGEDRYDWGTLRTDLDFSINQAGKKAFVVTTVGYCPALDWPSFLRERVASHRTPNEKGCPSLQFWDPEYIRLYKEYIYAMADFLAEFDATDRFPERTDILFVRAQVMADTMENLPKDYENWTWRSFNQASNGRIHQVDLTEEIAYAYQREIVLTYKRALTEAYARRGLRVAPVPATKGGGNWEEFPTRDFFASEGIWFDKHSGAPNPPGWQWDMVDVVRKGNTRGAHEAGRFPPTALLAQYTYWEVLMALHTGVEFLGIYGSNPSAPRRAARRRHGICRESRGAALWRSLCRCDAQPRPAAPAPGLRFAAVTRKSALGATCTRCASGRILATSCVSTGRKIRLRSLASATRWSRIRAMSITPVVNRSSRHPLTEDLALCRELYPDSECEFIEQQPDLLLNSGGRLEYTFRETDLGQVLYCETNAFCEDRGAATRSEPMFYARRTDGANGHSAMRFDLDDRYARSLDNRATVRVVYLDRGNDTWALQYDSQGARNKQARVVQKTNSNLWKEIIIQLDDVRFENRQQGDTDLALDSLGDGDDIFHLIEVIREGVPQAEQGDPTGGDNGTLPKAPAPKPEPILGTNVFREQAGEVVIEAERFSTRRAGSEADQTWQWSSDFGSASGEGVLRALPDRGTMTEERLTGPMVAYRIEFAHPGRYQVAVRGLGPDAEGNSIHIGLNGERVTDPKGLSWPVGDPLLTWRHSYSQDGVDALIPVVVDVPTAGAHTLNLWMREDGIVVDKIWLTRIGASEQPPSEGAPDPGDPADSSDPADPADDPVKSPIDEGSPELGPTESPVEAAPLTRIQLPIVLRN